MELKIRKDKKNLKTVELVSDTHAVRGYGSD